MAELLEQIKQMSRAEQLALIQQVWDLEPEENLVEADPEFGEELIRRALAAKENGFRGRSAEEAMAGLRRANERRAAGQ